ncbi:MAG: RNA-guided pseudouridylation complex pseudouridine synthase subunit Cbf5 [Nanoarchaeota archaeon]
MKPFSELLEFSIINLDKPAGPTSFEVALKVKDIFEIDKVGHCGTLDPGVSGVLPLTLGRACKISEYFKSRDKKYVGIMRLHEEIKDKELKKIIDNFIGKIRQMPPVRSSVKREEREREIYSFDILEREDKDVLFECHVEAGTYIRKLIHDIGLEIGGAHMLELRRTGAGFFDELESVTLYQLEEAIDEYKKGKEGKIRKILIPAEEAIAEIMPSVQLKNNVEQILKGKPLMIGDVGNLPESERFALFYNKKFIAIMRKSLEGEIIARAEFVFN